MTKTSIKSLTPRPFESILSIFFCICLHHQFIAWISCMNGLKNFLGFPNILDKRKSYRLDELFNVKFVSHPKFGHMGIKTIVAHKVVRAFAPQHGEGVTHNQTGWKCCGFFQIASGAITLPLQTRGPVKLSLVCFILHFGQLIIWGPHLEFHTGPLSVGRLFKSTFFLPLLLLQ